MIHKVRKYLNLDLDHPFSINNEWEFGQKLEVIYNNVPYIYCFLRSEDYQNEFVRQEFFLDENQYHKTHYLKNKDKQEKHLLHDYVNKYKKERGCAKCGYNEHACALDMDHIDPSQKKFRVSRLCSMYKNNGLQRDIIWALAMEEIAKCQVLCKNCHSVKTKNNKCGIKKQITSYINIDDYLIQNNKSTAIQMSIDFEKILEIRKQKKKSAQNKNLVLKFEKQNIESGQLLLL